MSSGKSARRRLSNLGFRILVLDLRDGGKGETRGFLLDHRAGFFNFRAVLSRSAVFLFLSAVGLCGIKSVKK